MKPKTSGKSYVRVTVPGKPSKVFPNLIATAATSPTRVRTGRFLVHALPLRSRKRQGNETLPADLA